MSSTCAGSGTAKLPIGNYHMPLLANIQVTLLGLVVGSTSSPVSVWGGDAYSVSLPLGLAGGLVGAGPSPGGASASVAVPTPTTIAPAVGGAVQSAAAPSIGAVASAAPSSKAAAGPVAAMTATPLTALSLFAALGGRPSRGMTLGQDEPC